MHSDSQDDDCCEEDSEFLQKVSPHPLTNEQQMPPQADQQVVKKVDEYDQAEMVDEGEDDDKSMEDNYDEEEMPEDTDYNRRVQLLHENRQRNA